MPVVHDHSPPSSTGRPTRKTTSLAVSLVENSGLGEPLHKGQCLVSHFPPPVVDGERVPAIGDLDDLGYARVTSLPLVRGIGDGPRYGVVLLTVDYEQRSSIWIFGPHFGLGPRVEIGGRRLEKWHTGSRHGEGGVELLCLVLADCGGETAPELLVGER